MLAIAENLRVIRMLSGMDDSVWHGFESNLHSEIGCFFDLAVGVGHMMLVIFASRVS